MRAIALALALVLVPGLAEAQSRPFLSADGVLYVETINNSGTVLTGARETIYLGRSCDAFIPGIGTGAWVWDRGGTLVRIGRYTVLFPGQIPLLSPPALLS